LRQDDACFTPLFPMVLLACGRRATLSPLMSR
jgi:hypothetical protein